MAMISARVREMGGRWPMAGGGVAVADGGGAAGKGHVYPFESLARPSLLLPDLRKPPGKGRLEIRPRLVCRGADPLSLLHGHGGDAFQEFGDGSLLPEIAGHS